MKRIILLVMAICMAAATGVSAKGGSTLKERLQTSNQDTIVVKMANGAKMILHLENIQQLQAFQNYSLDSLMRELTKYVERVDQMESSNKESKEMTVTFNKQEAQAGQTEQVTITVQEQDSIKGQGTNKETHEVRINKSIVIKVDVEEDNGNTKVNVDMPSKQERDSTREAKEAESYKATRFGFDMDLGFNTFTDIDNTPDLKAWGSRYVSLNWRLTSQIGGRKSPVYLLSGLEFAFNNYMFEDDVLVQDIDGVTVFSIDPEVNYEKSKLTHSSVNLPLMLMLQSKRDNGKDGFTIAAGPFIGYRLGSHSKLKFNGDKEKDRDSFNLSDIQYGAEGVIGYGSLKLFGKYNMNDLFKDNRGPETSVVSFGLRLFL
ncbi:outer membrane beta-barrel protein [uncultured Pontibacter sp.]|uniref:outer membrane beta-barrel protein n=1 Tax=uncultured Pontibacter sp. TaxID=453356 RepID=UPI0026139314|nr:outer membrane beta-barrel protein [uncultured Pontibacter sp.]